MTAMPQLVSLFNAVGGGAAALIAIDDYLAARRRRATVRLDTNIFIVLDIIIGSITFTGSLIAVGQAAGPDPGQADPDPGRPARDRSRLAVDHGRRGAVPVRDRHARTSR